MDIKISERGTKFLQSIEGFSNSAYYDKNGWAICFGNHYHPDGRPVLQGDKVSFSNDSTEASNYIKMHLENNVYFRLKKIKADLTQNEIDSLCSFVYNYGHLPVPLKKAVESRNVGTVKSLYEQYVKSKDRTGKSVVDQGLVKRRDKEFKLYSTGTVPSIVTTNNKNVKIQEDQQSNQNLSLSIIKIAKSQVGVTESPAGSNGGPRVDQYLKSVQLNTGNYWCMAFVYWVYQKACEEIGIKNPLVRTGLVMGQWNLIKNAIKATNKEEGFIIPGSIFIMDYGHDTGHTGIVIARDNGYITTIEGNTSTDGSRNGTGVFQRRRPISSIKGVILIQDLLRYNSGGSTSSLSGLSERDLQLESSKQIQTPPYRLITNSRINGCTLQEFIEDNLIKMTPQELLEYKDFDNSNAIFSAYKSQDLTKFNNKASVDYIAYNTTVAVPYSKLSSKSVYNVNQTLTLNKANNAFVESGIKALMSNPDNIAINTNGFDGSGDTFIQVNKLKVYLWSKAIDPTGSTVMDISRFVLSITSNTNHDGTNFTIGLASINFNTKADFKKLTMKDLYSTEHSDLNYGSKQIFQEESQVYVEQFKLSANSASFVDDNQEFKNNEYKYFRRNRSFFETILQGNDMILIRYDSLDSDKDFATEDLMISSNQISGKTYDIIGLVDTASKNTSFTAESVVNVSGRDLSKALIDDGVYFFNLEYAVSDREQIIKNSTSGKSGNRLIIPQQSTDKSQFESMTRSNLGSIVGDRTFNFLQTQSVEEWLTFIFSQLTNIDVCPDSLFDGYNEKTFIITREQTKGEFNYKRIRANGIWNICKLAIDPEIGDRRLADPSFTTASGSLLNLVKKIAQPPFIEFYMDTYGDKFYFICRKPPFAEKSFKTNVCLNIFEQQVITDNLSFSTDFYTWYKLNPAGSMLEVTNGSSMIFLPAVMFPEYMEVWGSKVLDVTTQFLDFDQSQSDQTQTNLENIKKQGQQDLDWLIETNAYLPFTREGTITVKLDRRIKRGINIRYLPTGEIFHVDGVQHTKATGKQISSSTTIHVSRGMVEEHLDKYFSVINLLRRTQNSGQWDSNTWTVNKEVFEFLLQRKQMM